MKRTSFVLFVALILILVAGLYVSSIPVQAMPALPAWDSATVISVPRAPANVRYVAPGGSDSTNCLSESSPCATIQHAIDVATGESVTISDTIQLKENASGYIEATITIPADKYVIIQGSSGKQATTVIKGHIFSNGPQLGINNVTIQNSSSSSNPGLYITGTATHTVFVRNSIFDSNVSTGNGGAIYNGGAQLTVLRSTFSNNSAAAGAAIYNNTGATTIISQTAVISSTAGGGVRNLGTFNAVNTTFGNNTGGGVTNSSGELGLYNVTVANNGGTGVSVAGGTATLQNSILALNTTDCSGSATGGFNFIGTGSCLTNGTNGNQVGTGTAINLGALAYNDGPTLNYRPGSGSPAIDAGNNTTGCTDNDGNLLGSDQRSAVRPQGSRCDIGSVETGDAPLLLTISPDTKVAGSGDFTLTLTGVDFPTTACWVLFNGARRDATCNPTTDTATTTITNTEILIPGTVNVVLQKGPLGDNIYSNPLQFTIAPNSSLNYLFLPLIMR